MYSMKAAILSCVLLLLLSSAAVSAQTSCSYLSDGRITLGNSSVFTFPNRTRLYTGRVDICINGTAYPVCANGLNTTLGVIPSANLTGVCRLTQPYQGRENNKLDLDVLIKSSLIQRYALY